MPNIPIVFNNDNFDNLLQIGTVVAIEENGINHPKLNIILDISNGYISVASVFINSGIDPSRISSAESRALQLPITPDECPFLDHDSFVDCSRIHDKSYSEYRNVVINSMSKRKGVISNTLLQTIFEKVRQSTNISPKQKKKFKTLFP